MQLSEVMILYEEAVGSCLVPFLGCRFNTIHLRAGLGTARTRHRNARTPHSPSDCCRKNRRSFDWFCLLQVKDQCLMDTQGRETSFSFIPINSGRGLSSSELFGSFEDLRLCSRIPELHKQWRTRMTDSFLDIFFLMRSKPT